MNNISVDEIMLNFLNTFKVCGDFLYTASDSDVEYYIFEEYDTQVVSFLHEDNLTTLLNNGLITEEIKDNCLKLREYSLTLLNGNDGVRSAHYVKNSRRWAEIFSLISIIKGKMEQLHKDKYALSPLCKQDKKTIHSNLLYMFYEVFDYVGSFVLNLSDVDLVDLIYEDYMFYYTYWIDYNLQTLQNANIITKEVANKAREIRNLSDKMFCEDVEFSANFIRTSKDWQTIFMMVDNLKNQLKGVHYKDLTEEINKALPLSTTFVQAIIIDYAINKRGYDFDWDYPTEKVLEILKGDEWVGIILTEFPLGFVLNDYYDDFNDLKGYHLIKVDNFDKVEWSLDVEKMQKIAPSIGWHGEKPAWSNPLILSVLDFKFYVE